MEKYTDKKRNKRCNMLNETIQCFWQIRSVHFHVLCIACSQMFSSLECLQNSSPNHMKHIRT